MAGAIKDQKDAAIITPALKPKMVSKILPFISLKKHTIRAPKAVTAHVKVVANIACITGVKLSNQFNLNHLIPYYIIWNEVFYVA